MKKKLLELVLYAVLIAAVMALGAWFVDGVLRIILLAVLYFVEMESLLSIVRLILKEPEPVKMREEEAVKAEDEWYLSRQNPAVMARVRPLGIILCGVAFLLLLDGIAGLTSYEVHSAACLLCAGSCVVLCAVFPGYFSFNHLEGEKGRMCSFPIVNVLMPLVLSLGAGCMRALTEFTFLNWLAVLKGMLLAAAVWGMVMRLAVAEFRRHTGNWAGVMILVLMFSLGLAAPVNCLLDPQPHTVTGTVTEYHPGAYRVPAEYTLVLDNGEEINMMARDGFLDRSYGPGDEIELEYHRGGLGIEYYTYAD